MHIKAKFQAPRIDLNRYKEALHARLSEKLAQAGMEYLEATAEAIPEWSSASKATFSPLACHVGYVLTFEQAPGAPNRVELGLENGTAEFVTNPDTGLYSFTYYTTLPHLIVNEYYNANTFVNPKTGHRYFKLIHPGPYHFQEAGKKAFQLEAVTVILPDWRDSVTVKTIRVQ